MCVDRTVQAVPGQPGAAWQLQHEGDMTQSAYVIRLRKRGQLTLPQAVRRSLAVEAGDMLILVQVDDVLFLSRRETAVSDLSQQF